MTNRPWIGALAVAVGWQVATLGIAMLAPSPRMVWGISELLFGGGLAVLGALAAWSASLPAGDVK